jgi:hypothetical protein
MEFSLTGSIRGLNACGKVLPKHSKVYYLFLWLMLYLTDGSQVNTDGKSLGNNNNTFQFYK